MAITPIISPSRRSGTPTSVRIAPVTELGFGVGIALGYATLGRIGFEGRFDYGAVGKVVILASRLSAEARAGQILLSQRVRAAVEDDVEAEPVGELALKGFQRPETTFNVLGLKERGAS